MSPLKAHLTGLTREMEFVTRSLCQQPLEPVPEDENELYKEFSVRDVNGKEITEPVKRYQSLLFDMRNMDDHLNWKTKRLDEALQKYHKFLKKAAGGYEADPAKVKNQTQTLVDEYLVVREFLDKTRSGQYPKLSEFIRRFFRYFAYKSYDLVPHAYAVIKLQDAYGTDQLPYKLFMEVGKGKQYSENDLMGFYTRALGNGIASDVCHRGIMGFFAIVLKPKKYQKEGKGAIPCAGRVEAELEKCYAAYYKNVRPGRGLLTENDNEHVRWRSDLKEGDVLHSICMLGGTGGSFYRKHHVFTLGNPDTANAEEDLFTFPVTSYETWEGHLVDQNERHAVYDKNAPRIMDWTVEEWLNIPPKNRERLPHEQLQIVIGKSAAEPYLNSLHPGRCWNLPVPPVKFIDPLGRFVVQRRMTPVIPLEVLEGKKEPSAKPLDEVTAFIKLMLSSSETPIPLSPKYLVVGNNNVLHYSQYVRKGRFDLFRIEKFILEASAKQSELFKAYGEKSGLYVHPYHKMLFNAIIEFVKDRKNDGETIDKHALIQKINDRGFSNAAKILMERIGQFLWTCSEEIESKLFIGKMVPEERAKVRAIFVEKWSHFKTATFIWPTLREEVVQEYLKQQAKAST